MPIVRFPQVSKVNKSGTMVYSLYFTSQLQYGKTSKNKIDVVCNSVVDNFKDFENTLQYFSCGFEYFDSTVVGYKLIKYVLDKYPNFTGTFVTNTFRIPFVDGKLHTSSGKMCIFYDSNNHPTAHFNFYMGEFNLYPDPAIWCKHQFHAYTSNKIKVTVDDLFNGGKDICHKFFNTENPTIEPISGASWTNDKKLVSFTDSDNLYWYNSFKNWCQMEKLPVDHDSFLTYILINDPKTYSKQEIISHVFFVA